MARMQRKSEPALDKADRRIGHLNSIVLTMSMFLCPQPPLASCKLQGRCPREHMWFCPHYGRLRRSSGRGVL